MPRLPLRVALKRSIAVSLVAFAMVMAVLTVRMANGADPALGPKLAARADRAASGQDTAASAPVGMVVPTPAVSQPAPAPAPVQTTTS